MFQRCCVQSGQPLAPEVKDATSVATSLAAWDGYPSRSPELSEEIPTLSPAKPDLLPLDSVNAVPDDQLSSPPALPPNIEFIYLIRQLLFYQNHY